MEDEKWVKELTTADKVVIEEALEAYLNEYFGGENRRKIAKVLLKEVKK